MTVQINFTNESGYSSVSVVERVDINEALIKSGGNIYQIRRGQRE
jgi:hypothetical protein